MQLRLEQTRPIYPPNVHDLNTKTQGQLVLIELGYGYNYAPGRVCTSTRGMSLACLRTYRRLGGEKILRLVRDVFGCVCSCVFFSHTSVTSCLCRCTPLLDSTTHGRHGRRLLQEE